VIGKGLTDELGERIGLIVDGVDGASTKEGGESQRGACGIVALGPSVRPRLTATLPNFLWRLSSEHASRP